MNIGYRVKNQYFLYILQTTINYNSLGPFSQTARVKYQILPRTIFHWNYGQSINNQDL